MHNISDQKIQSKLIDILRMIKDNETLHLTMNSELKKDIDLDSMEKVEMIFEIEDEFKISITDYELRDLITFRDVVLIIAKKLNVLSN